MSECNITKFLQYLTMVAKKPIVVDRESYFQTKSRIKLQKTFFYKDNCENCGGCCVAESNLYTPHEYDRIMKITEAEYNAVCGEFGFSFDNIKKLRNGLKDDVHNINGEDVTFHIYKLEKNDMFLPTRGRTIPRCSWVTQIPDGRFLCTIHPIVSLTCDMPHLRLFHSSAGTISIGIQQFGRNWALHCPVNFYEPETEEEFIAARENRLRKLERIQGVADELKIETYLPEIFDYINRIPFNNYKSYLERDCVSMNKRFWRGIV